MGETARSFNNCKVCGKPYTDKPSHLAWRVACSVECRMKWMSKRMSGKNNPSYRGAKIKRKCEICEKGFEVFVSRIKDGKGRFCSKGCDRAFRRKNAKRYIQRQQPDGSIIREHRAIAEAAMGRKLRPKEVIHHVNRDKKDNRNENLLICLQGYHLALHKKMAQLDQQAGFWGIRDG